MQLEAKLEGIRQDVDRALLGLMHKAKSPAPRIHAAVDYALQAGGKRIRPALAILAGELGKVSHELLLDCSLCLEILHTYSLIHDDLPCMDGADLRRGRPTLHRIYDEAMATLAGDAMLTLAWESLIEAGCRHGVEYQALLRSILDISKAVGMGGMIGGQVLDLEGEKKSLSLEELRELHAHKTGCLFVASLVLGGRLAGLCPEKIAALTEYGKAFGLVFQITDDLLDLEASTVQLGKTSGRDEHLGKSTYVTILGVDEARRLAREEAQKAKQALSIFDEQVSKYLQELVESLLERKF